MASPPYDPSDASPVRLALTLVRSFGGDALAIVRERAEQAAPEPEAATRWQAIADIIETLNAVGASLRSALASLDEIGELTAAPYIDLALHQLGLNEGSDAQPNAFMPMGFSRLSK